MKVAMNNFAKRQVPGSPYSYFKGTFDELCALVEENLDKKRPGYAEGIFEVPLDPTMFSCPVIKIGNVESFETTVEARDNENAKEEAHIITRGKGTQEDAVECIVAIYSREALGDDVSTEDADFEIVTINASPVKEEPMHPVTMARNQLGKAGGTEAKYTSEEWATATWYWSQHVMPVSNS